MRLFEYQVKYQLSQYNVPVSSHVVVGSYEGIRHAIKKLGGTLLLKPQAVHNPPPVRVNANELDDFVLHDIFGLDMTIRSILVEKLVSLQSRIYLSIKANEAIGRLELTAHRHEDGANLEESCLINPFIGLREYQIRDIASSINLPKLYWQTFTTLSQNLYQCYVQNDAIHLSLNPLGISQAGQFIALNPQMTIDEAALQRQPNFYMLHTAEAISPTSHRAKQVDIAYYPLGGNVCCITNGIGSGLVALDELHLSGNQASQPGGLINIGNLVQTEKIDMGLKIALSDPEIDYILMNLFGSITSCQAIVRKIIDSYEGVSPEKPIIVCLSGIGATEGIQIMEKAGIQNVYTFQKLQASIAKLTQLAEKGKPPDAALL